MKNKKSGFAFAPLLLIIAALAAIGIGGYYVGQSQKPAPQLAISNEIGGAGLSLEQIKNATVSLDEFTDAKLDDGHAEKMIFMGKGDGAPNTKITLDLAKVALGDLNGDGQSDAVAFMVERTGGTGSFGNLVVFLNKSSQPVQIPGVIGLGDREPVQNLTIENGVITLDLLTHDSGEPLCCAATPRTDKYKLEAGQLVKITSSISSRLTDKQISDFVVSRLPTATFRSNARLKQIVRGDINGDGFSDAVIVLFACDASCGDFEHVVLDKNGAPQLSEAVFPSFGYGAQNPYIKVLSISNGIITVDQIVEEKSIGIYKYKLQGGNLVEVKDPAAVSNWKTYTSDQYGFEFKYPPENFKVEAEDNLGGLNLKAYPTPQPIEFGPVLNIHITYDKQGLPTFLSDLKTRLGKYFISDEIVKVGNNSWHKIRSIDDYFGEEAGVSLYTSKNDKIYSVYYFQAGYPKAEFEEIISTFKFTK